LAGKLKARLLSCVCQDLLEYKKKHRVLRVKMLDGSVKTLMVDDSHTVSQMMITVCSKIGLSTGLFVQFIVTIVSSSSSSSPSSSTDFLVWPK